ncbi:protein-L-isoaspartate(D-aspartate) O-methyltransferase [Curvibacter sp. HBC61]|uniref:Protein-L-isoaspartate O-methyltransferase n=1 Tax=Curvibacter cyanobacteriorum TaxID=3026422 RepID=A0ABT5MTK5_9BURK|nr:protein-L-isoaspartate(D-aspartate) O-methyltransferase [Curvibacter sp. HBC61]MDD0837197.1 protein-L-isoaspartate(D-aspartate) O-methyltransferase [Curvibacter sp. HBC61]
MNQRRPGFPARLDQAVAPPGSRSAASGPATATAQRPAPVKPQRPGAGDRPPGLAIPTGLGMDSAAVRQRMVQKLAAQGVQSAAVLTAMGTVERHRFVDSALVNQAYEDTSLPIGLGQTISKPNVVARMLELLTQAPGAQGGAGLGRVLEIGTGCGYQAAVLSHLAREVYSIERLRGLHEKARDNLRPMRLANVHLLLGDGMLGYDKGAPYAGIVAAAGGEAVPEAWCQQLAVGGRLVAPTVMAGGRQALVVIDKTHHGLQQTVLEAVHFVPLKSGIA